MTKKSAEWLSELSQTVSPDQADLLKRACDTLEANTIGDGVAWAPYRCIVPFHVEKEKTGIWNWDSAFHAMTVLRWDPELAQECLEGFMNYQLPNGLFPDVVRANGEVVDSFGKPPVLATACEAVYQANGDKLFLKRAYMRLLKYEAFMCAYRKFGGMFFYDARTENDDTYDLYVRYESGWDNSVRWDDPCVNYWPVDLNCFMIMTYRSLAFMSQELGDLDGIPTWREKEQALTQLVNERLWNDAIRAYTDTNRLNGKKSTVLTPASFMPLYIGIAPQDYAEQMNLHARNPDEFYPGMPTVAYNHPEYSQVYWRGPTWLNVAYFAAKGLKNYGFTVADDIRRRILELVSLNEDAIYENYDSLAGKGLHSKHFSWSACFVIEFILNW